MKPTSWILALCSAAALTACGGSNDDTPPPTQQVPAGTSTSVSEVVSYLKALIASDADALEPVDLSNVTLAVDDQAPPESVD